MSNDQGHGHDAILCNESMNIYIRDFFNDTLDGCIDLLEKANSNQKQAG